MDKTIIIFANSVKNHQHCVAGKEIETKKWIRPVGDENGCELTGNQITALASPVKVLQKVTIEFSQDAPLINQPENYIISDKQWKLRDEISRDKVQDFLDNPSILWANERHRNDRVDYQQIKNGTIKIESSLYLISVDKIHVYWRNRTQYDQTPQRRGKFKYKDIDYDFAITDRNFTEYVEQDLDKKYLCISLGLEFNDYCYKIITSIF